MIALVISAKLIAVGQRKHSGIEFLEGDIEHLPFPDASFEGVLERVADHFPDPSRCAAEKFWCRARRVASSPSIHRMTRSMWLYCY